MDEILQSPKARAERLTTAPTYVPAQEADRAGLSPERTYAGFWDSVVARVTRWRRQYPERKTRRIETHVKHPLRTSIPFLMMSAVTGISAILMAYYTPCYSLAVNASTVGYVADAAAYARVAEQVEGQVSRAMGQTFSLENSADLHFTLAQKELVLTNEQISDRLFATVPAVTQAYELSVDGIPVGVAADKVTLDGALTTLKNQYVSENTISVSFPNEVRITHKYVPTSTLGHTQDEFLHTLTQVTPQNAQPPVASNPVFDPATMQKPMAVDTLITQVPAAASQAVVGEQSATTPLLSVRVVDNVSYTAPIESPVVEQTDDTLYIGDRVVRTQGTVGEALIRADVTKLNGVEQKRDIISNETLVEPTTTVVAVGTKERPATAPTGVFMWPCQGRITSPFGPRFIFGSTSFHSGIDIANSYGTPLMAADGGKVVFAGSKGSYGNLVIVDHGNGYETYYAHCQAFLVSEGDAVYQGQPIAQMGATGRATGSHCHFEVRYGGEAYDPMFYLP